MTAASPLATAWPLACPACRAPLGPLRRPRTPGDALGCSACGGSYGAADGAVWDLLAPARAVLFARFLEEYTAVRRAEGRAGLSPAALRALPRVPRGHPLAWQWRIRARSMACLLRRVLPGLGPAPRILDLGAGTGWLSHHLARRGARPLAVDLSLDPGDGLAAARHLDAAVGDWLPRARADFDHLPLAEGAADAVVFNASLHYSADYHVTLSEALRVLAPGAQARIVIVDSPIYRAAAHGAAMVAERRAAYRARYGYASDALGSREFLTEGDLAALADALGLRWRAHRPAYGLRWAARGPLARLRGRRPPARFAVLEGRRAPGGATGRML